MTDAGGTIPSLFFGAASSFGGRTAFNYFEGVWKSVTYGELSQAVLQLMQRLADEGISQGDRIAIISENKPAWCIAYLASVSLGGVAVPLDAQLTEREVGVLLSDSEARIVFHSVKTEPLVREALGNPSVRGINLDVPTGGVQAPLPAPSEGDFRIMPDETASLIYTSGTTGQPKGVMLSHRNLCADADALIRADLVSEKDNILALLPLHHTYPFMCTFLMPILLGAAVTFSPGLKAAEMTAAIRDRAVTIVVAVPRLLEMIRDGILSRMRAKPLASPLLRAVLSLSGRLRRGFDINLGRRLFSVVHRNFPFLRFFTSGGARLDPAVMEDLEAIGFTVLEGYGLTETSPAVTFTPPDRRKPGSAGKALPSAEMKTGPDGEILVKGPMVMKGYYRNPSETEEVLRDGWFSTGDLGYLDEEGYLFITGRRKEVIVLSTGKNVYPEEVEKLYLSAPIIREICVLRAGGKDAADSLHVVVVPDLEYAKRAGISNVSEEVKWQVQGISMGLPEHLRVRGCTVVAEALPRTPLGKLRRFMVRDLVKGRSATERGRDVPAVADDAVGRKALDSLRPLLPEGTVVGFQDNLELDLGLDSLKKVEFLSSLEQAFEMPLPESLLVEAQTVADVVTRLRELSATGPADGSGGLSWTDVLNREPTPDERATIGFTRSALARPVAGALFGLHRVLFRLLFGLTTKGSEHIPAEGAFILAPNHASHLDGFAVAASVSFGVFERLYFLGLEKFFRGPLRSRFARASHVIPIDPELSFARALGLAAYVLRNDRGLCIFPEGGRSPDGSVQRFKKGVGMLAVETDVLLVPVFIKGTFQALPRGARFIRPARVTVTFGAPLRVSLLVPEVLAGTADRHQVVADLLRDRVVALADE